MSDSQSFGLVRCTLRNDVTAATLVSKTFKTTENFLISNIEVKSRNVLVGQLISVL